MAEQDLLPGNGVGRNQAQQWLPAKGGAHLAPQFLIAFLPRSKCFLISWLQSSSTVILEPKKIKSVTAFTFFYLFAMKGWGWMP